MLSAIQSFKIQTETKAFFDSIGTFDKEHSNIASLIDLQEENVSQLLEDLSFGMDKEMQFVLNVKLKRIKEEYKLSLEDLKSYCDKDEEGFFSAVIDIIVGFFKAIINFISGLFGSGSGGGGSSSPKSADEVIKNNGEVESKIDEARELIEKSKQEHSQDIDKKSEIEKLEQEINVLEESISTSMKRSYMMSMAVISIHETMKTMLDVKDPISVTVDSVKRISSLIDSVLNDQSLNFNYDAIEDTTYNKVVNADSSETIIPVGIKKESIVLLRITTLGTYSGVRQINSVKRIKVPTGHKRYTKELSIHEAINEAAKIVASYEPVKIELEKSSKVFGMANTNIGKRKDDKRFFKKLKKRWEDMLLVHEEDRLTKDKDIEKQYFVGIVADCVVELGSIMTMLGNIKKLEVDITKAKDDSIMNIEKAKKIKKKIEEMM